MAFDAGSLVGAGIGAMTDYIIAKQNRDEARSQEQAKRRAIQTANAQANSDYNAMLDKLNDYNDDRISLANNATVQAYLDTINNYKPQVYDFDKFSSSYKKTVDDFINPEANKIAEMAGLNTQAQLAGQGAGLGTGADATMGYSRWEAAKELYNDAQSQMNADRSQAYREYSDYITNMQNKLNQMSQNQLNKAQLLGGAISNEQAAQSDYIADLLGVMGDKAQTNVNATIGAF